MRFTDDPIVREELSRVRPELLRNLRDGRNAAAEKWVALADTYLMLDPNDEEVRDAREVRARYAVEYQEIAG